MESHEQPVRQHGLFGFFGLYQVAEENGGDLAGKFRGT